MKIIKIIIQSFFF